MKIDVTNRDEMLRIIKSCIGTKIISKWSDMACNIALDAVSTVSMEENGRKEIDIKRYAKVEKVMTKYIVAVLQITMGLVSTCIIIIPIDNVS